MWPLRNQFFLLFGTFGAVMPYLAIMLRERGFDEEQVGYALGISGWAIVLSPALITLIADTAVTPRRLMAALGVITGSCIFGMLMSSGFWSVTIWYFVYSLAIAAMIPLHDGIVFGFAKQQQELGKPEVHYNELRVWGTYGYVVILLLTVYPVKLTGDSSVGIWFGFAAFCLIIANTFVLPDRGRRETAKRAQGLPTGAAFKALFGRRNVVFSVSMFLLLAASSAYHVMYPIYLTEDLGLAKHWVGVVIVFGAAIEVFFIIRLSRWQKRWGLRAVMLASVWATVLRFGLMFAFPNLPVAIGTQVLHGMMICGMMVIPPVYINSLADESYRNSIQGVYTMLVIGTSRFAGTAVAGHVAAVDQRYVNLACLIFVGAALVLLWAGFKPVERERSGETGG
ncbi:MFS transporter [Pelagicoccus mobilis]|uniref:MFS transporter n=1 Tax=Pelagicoccus mobilis TaxID=415221 RepID=A0A934RUU6_9BACT|nr:MFS transporter [Pelagicoccus mobilis]MBK1876866.1 MFS transporter [Pelagicoccus mobilis]